MRIVGKVGDIALDLGGRWQRDLRVSVSSIVGGISITAPSTIGIELESSGVLSRDNVEGSFSHAGDIWRSTGFDTAEVKVRIAVRSLLGKVTLIQR
jgi:predicted membrane protein